MILILIIVIYIYYQKRKFDQTTYAKSTHNTFLETRRNAGLYGEYVLFTKLKDLEKTKAKFLFNVYLPKGDGETTEIDQILVCANGVFVFESKNYKGWIFGDGRSSSWTQTFKRSNKSKKYHFFNPVIQNQYHVKYLNELLEMDIPVYSLIVFSNECILKKVDVNLQNTCVTQYNGVVKEIYKFMQNHSGRYLSNDEIDSIYTKLYPYTQVSEEVKKKHIEEIRTKYNN